MKTPWWFLHKTPLAFILVPVSWIYYLFSKIVFVFRKIGAYKSRRKIICVGNIMAGGVGKTPVVREIAEFLDAPVVMRGYNGKLSCNKNALMVDSNIHSFFDVGDEALMINLKSNADVFINRNRKLCMSIIDKAFYDVVVMDDEYGIGRSGRGSCSGSVRCALSSGEQ